jgi:rhodanese-related sulfurtransferase
MIRILTTIILLLLPVTACAEQTASSSSEDTVPRLIRTVSASESASMIAGDASIVILDVRSPEEFSEGHIEGARNINYHDEDFQTRIAALDKSTPYLLLCHSGVRSGKTERLLKSFGFTNVAHLKSGIAGWRKEGLPRMTKPRRTGKDLP